LACVALLALAGCVIVPTGWDARTDGGRYPPDKYGRDECDSSRWGIDDMRSEAQNDLCIGGWHIKFR
jgi:hypothetical protein